MGGDPGAATRPGFIAIFILECHACEAQDILVYCDIYSGTPRRLDRYEPFRGLPVVDRYYEPFLRCFLVLIN
jgi:hypothetical protein